MNEIKIALDTIQFKRGSINNLPKEAKYGEPLLVYSNEGKYSLYMGLGEGKSPILLAGDFAAINSTLDNLKKQINNIADRLDNNKASVLYDSETKNLTISAPNTKFQKEDKNFMIK